MDKLLLEREPRLSARWSIDTSVEPVDTVGGSQAAEGVLRRYDRPFGPEWPSFGKVRYMTSRNTARKVRLRRFLEDYG